jgi:biotin carboxyl carrier protein
MRTYLIDADKNEIIVDLTKTTKHSSELVEFEFSTMEERVQTHKETVFVRKLAGNYYSSFDKKRWKKIARQSLPKKILSVDRVFDVYRGYKPSGLSSGSTGELFTQMPGKIVKINVAVGDQVEAGETILILEAMKMENEIKSGVSGTVKTIHVKEGEALDSGVLMLEIE